MNQQAVIQMLLNKIGSGNPVINNAANMYKNGDAAGLEKIARNLCASKGIDPNDALNRAKGMFAR